MKNTHLSHLQEIVPDLKERRILDIGAGRGTFLIDAARRGIPASGIEYKRSNVVTAHARAAEAGVVIDLAVGNAEHLPYESACFDFVNLSEVIEHVQDPEAVLAEIFRVLHVGGSAYVSVPSRYSWYDTHFHIPFVNWLPRAWSDSYIAVWKRHKDYQADPDADVQRLSEMHYYTYRGAERLVRAAGFSAEDLRLAKLKKRFQNPIVRSFVKAAYYLFRPWYFRAFHILIRKPS